MNKGFTLMELMAVVIIVAILSAVALPQYTRAVNRARLSEAVSHLAIIQKGIDMYCTQFKADCLDSNTACFSCSNGPRLDGDVLKSLNYEGAGRSSSEKFYYHAECWNATCTVDIEPRFPGLPTLHATRPVSSGLSSASWTKTCTGGESVYCESLHSQGFSAGS